MSNCFKGDEVDFEELIDPNMEKFRTSLFKFLDNSLAKGPQAPKFDVNAQNDPNFAAGMNMFRDMGGLSTDYKPQQAPQSR